MNALSTLPKLPQSNTLRQTAIIEFTRRHDLAIKKVREEMLDHAAATATVHIWRCIAYYIGKQGEDAGYYSSIWQEMIEESARAAATALKKHEENQGNQALTARARTLMYLASHIKMHGENIIKINEQWARDRAAQQRQAA